MRASDTALGLQDRFGELTVETGVVPQTLNLSAEEYHHNPIRCLQNSGDFRAI
jgi:hypothetical protein